jgi:EmrB/QacA subfamily drug resistance transporter
VSATTEPVTPAAPDAPAAPAVRLTGRARWMAVIATLVGSYAAVLNVTVVGVALPAIADDLGTGGPLGVDWAVTAFLVGVMAVLPVTGWLADRLGRRHAYIAALGVFGVGSLLCAAAPTMELLVAARFVQGLGGGAVMPLSMAVVYDLFPPHRRGLGLGIWGVAIMAAPAAGPPLGGWLVTVASWRWIFVVFAGVVAGGITLAARWLPDVGVRIVRRLDVVGWALATVGITVAALGFRQVADWGLTSPATLATAVVAVGSITAMVRRSLRRADPILELRILAVPTYGAAMVLLALLQMAQFAQLTFLPVELQVVRGLDAQEVGLLMAPAAVGMAVLMPLGGWLVDRVGARGPVVIGMVLTAATFWELAQLRPDGPTSRVVVVLLVQGVGMGLVAIPAAVGAMNSLPNRFVAHATAMNNLIRQLGGIVGVAVLSALLVSDLGAVAPSDPVVDQAQGAYNRVFLVSFWLVVAATAAAFWLPGRARSHRNAAERTAELTGAPTP